MVETGDEPMSTLDPSNERLPTRTANVDTLIDRVRTALSGAAFWASIPLPLVIFAALLSGVATSVPLALVGLVLLNVCCAALGHSYTPTR